jgi:hypothetical protein
MPLEMRGRRIPIINLGTQPEPMVGEVPILERAGDYCGPFKDKIDGHLVVYFLLPNARDPETKGHGRSMRHVVSPPHRFIEEPNGSLTIRESIGAMPHWHGFLTDGRWESNKSKP